MLKEKYTATYHALVEDCEKAAWLEGWYDYNRDIGSVRDVKGMQTYWDGWNAAEAAEHDHWDGCDVDNFLSPDGHDAAIMADAFERLSPYRLVCQHGEGFKRICLPVGTYCGTMAGFVILASAIASDVEIERDRSSLEYILFEPSSMTRTSLYDDMLKIEFNLVLYKAV